MQLRYDHARERELADFDPFTGNQLIGDPLQGWHRTLDKYHLHHMIVLKLHLQRPDHLVDTAALERGQLDEHIFPALVVKQRDVSSHNPVTGLATMLYKALVDDRRHRLRPALEATRLNESIQLTRNLGRQRNADPRNRLSGFLGFRHHIHIQYEEYINS